VRRLVDVLVSSVVLLIFLIPGLILCVLQKMTSPGPIFFLQRRAGVNGAPFWLYKFRTMKVAQAAGASTVTQKGDSRITPLGGILRRTKLDEMPQFWNVLKGDMSLLGPRPEMEKFVHLYTPEQRGVLRVRPGLAFMAQLVYPHEPDLLEGIPDPERVYTLQLMPRKLEADLAYLRRRTFLSDLLMMAEIALLVVGYRPRMDTAFRVHAHETAYAQETPRS
jgi:lipopolysaccharide/colanic/teichoic acid biosynthesis glycosyltransferase